MRSQNALVGVRARPTHDNIRMTRHIRNVGLLPNWSEIGPQAIGATRCIRQQLVLASVVSRLASDGGMSMTYKLPA